MIDFVPSEQLMNPNTIPPFKTFFNKEIPPPKGSDFFHTVQVFQPDADSNTKIIAFGGKSTDGKEQIRPSGIQIEGNDFDDKTIAYIAEISARILAKVPVPVDTLASQLFDELAESRDKNDKRPLHERLVEDLGKGMNPAVLANFPLENVDFSGLK